MKTHEYSFTINLCIDRTIEGRQMTPNDRDAIEHALSNDDAYIACDIEEALNYVVEDNEEFFLGDVEWDTPELMPINGRNEVVVTVYLTIQSDIEDKARLDELVNDAVIFNVWGYETAEYS